MPGATRPMGGSGLARLWEQVPQCSDGKQGLLPHHGVRAVKGLVLH